MRSEARSLADILAYAREARAFLGGSTKEEYRADFKEQSSVNYALLVVGEVVRGLRPEFRDRHPAIEWSRIAGMRNLLAHEYGRIDPDVVWDVVNTTLPALIHYVEPLVPSPGNDDKGSPGGGPPSTRPLTAALPAKAGEQATPSKPSTSAPTRIPPTRKPSASGRRDERER